MPEKKYVSVVIPNRNREGTIEKCLQSVFASKGVDFEAIVVDDGSEDSSVERIGKFPCKIIKLGRHRGAGAARNEGAKASKGDLIFFTDSDCVLQEDTLMKALEAMYQNGSTRQIIGGIYSARPEDRGFFNRFQSAFVNHFERKRNEPDYIATHALAIKTEDFRKSAGFPEDFLPILEDVAFCHRMKRAGYTLHSTPGIQVSHIFNFGLFRSIKNAFRKSKYWIMYSIPNRDLLADSGTASSEIKFNGLAYSFIVLTAIFSIWKPWSLLITGAVLALNIFVNRGVIRAFREAGGTAFAFLASLYYFFLYPAPVIAGGISGVLSYFFKRNGK